MNQEPWCLEGEEWRVIAGYEGRYEVSNFGRVRRMSVTLPHVPVRMLTNTLGSNGRRYLVTLTYKDKHGPKDVARLVATAFVPNPENKGILYRLDGNPHNLHADNFVWLSVKEWHRKPENRAAAQYVARAYYYSHPDKLAKIRAFCKNKVKSVRHLETGILYRSMTAAANALGIPLWKVSQSAVRIARTHKAIIGMTWRKQPSQHFAFATMTDIKITYRHDAAATKRKAVICLETFDVWQSCKDAADSMGMSVSAICRSCQKTQRGFGGTEQSTAKHVLHFAYLEDYQKAQQQQHG